MKQSKQTPKTNVFPHFQADLFKRYEDGAALVLNMARIYTKNWKILDFRPITKHDLIKIFEEGSQYVLRILNEERNKQVEKLRQLASMFDATSVKSIDEGKILSLFRDCETLKTGLKNNQKIDFDFDWLNISEQGEACIPESSWKIIKERCTIQSNPAREKAVAIVLPALEAYKAAKEFLKEMQPEGTPDPFDKFFGLLKLDKTGLSINWSVIKNL